VPAALVSTSAASRRALDAMVPARSAAPPKLVVLLDDSRCDDPVPRIECNASANHKPLKTFGPATLGNRDFREFAKFS
jgi:hypothetical protein